MKKTILVPQHSREYSLCRVASFTHAVAVYFQKYFGCKEDTPVFIYFGSGRVYGCYPEGYFERLMQSIAARAKEEVWLSNVLRYADETFEKLLPYFEKEKSIESKEAFRAFYDLYTPYVLLVGVMQIAPSLSDIPEKVNIRAESLRKRTHVYSESSEQVFLEGIGMLLPNLQPRDRMFIAPEEVWDGEIEFGKITREIDERKKGYIYRNELQYQGESVHEHLEKLGYILVGATSRNNQNNKISGVVAQPGHASGKARLVFTEAELGTVQDGEILVAPMTMPKYLQAMKKAAAFVTDEGGISSHAAIMARELEKPCIIGTKVATQLLKNGDMVEVDADEGVVRIINQDREQ